MISSDIGEDPVFVAYNDSEFWGQGNPQNAGYMLAGPSIHFTGALGKINGDANSENEQTKLTAQWNAVVNNCIADMLEMKPEERIVTLPTTAEEAEEIAEVNKVVQSYWKTAAANFVTGEWDIDKQWDTYLSELEKMGIADLLAVYQTAYDRTK